MSATATVLFLKALIHKKDGLMWNRRAFTSVFRLGEDVLRSFPVAACFSLSQTFTIMAYSAGVLRHARLQVSECRAYGTLSPLLEVKLLRGIQ